MEANRVALITGKLTPNYSTNNITSYLLVGTKKKKNSSLVSAGNSTKYIQIGGASGIGLAVAEKCKRAGMITVVADIDRNAIKAVEAKFDLAVVCDATDPQQVKQLAELVCSKFNDIGFLMSNTGIMAGDSGFTTPLSTWRKTFEVTFMANVIAASEFVPRMLKQQQKKCVWINTASVAGLFNAHRESGTPYTVAKNASRIYTESLARELADTHISVHCLCPGPVNTALLRNSRIDPSVDKFSFEKDPMGMNEAALEQGLSPNEVADSLFDGIAKKKFYIVVTAASNNQALMAEMMRFTADDVENGISMPLSFRNSSDESRKRLFAAYKRGAKMAKQSKL